MGSNTIEFRWAIKKTADGAVVDQRLQFRTRDISVTLNSVSLSEWSEWRDVDVNVVEVTV